MRTAGLVRVSDPTRAEKGYSITDQQQAIQAYCQQAGDTLVELVIDAGVSGKDIERAGLARIDALIRAKAIDKVVYVRQDRLSREPWRALQLLAQWRQLGVLVISCERPNITGRNASERMIEAVEAGMADLEWERIREKTMGGRRRKAETGRVPFRFRTFGYTTIGKWQENLKEYEGRSGELEINEREAAIVRELFSRYVTQNHGIRPLCRWLDEQGITTTRGNRWCPQTVRGLLGNETYVGRLHIYKTEHRRAQEKTRRGGRKDIRTPRPAEEHLIIEVPPILVTPDGQPDEALFRRAQEKLQVGKQQKRGRPSEQWPLSGLIFCSHCVGSHGAPLGVLYTTTPRKLADGTTRRYEYLICMSRTHHQYDFCRLCCKPAVILERVHRAAVRQCQPGVLGAAAREKVKALEASTSDVRAVVQALEKDLRELEEQEARLENLILGGARPERVRERMQVLQAQRSQALAELENARKKVRFHLTADEAAAHAEAEAARLLTSLESAWASGDIPALREAYTSLLTVFLSPKGAVRVQIREGLLLGC